MVSLLILIAVGPILLMLRERKAVGPAAIVLLTIYYFCIGSVVDSVFFLENIWTKTISTLFILIIPLLLLYHDRLLTVLRSAVISFGILLVLFTAFTNQTRENFETHLEQTRKADKLPADLAFISRALHVLSDNSSSEARIVDAVTYLRSVSGMQIGNDPERWKEWWKSSSRVDVRIQTEESELADRGFSAVKATGCLEISKQTGNEFLPLYIFSVLPDYITSSDLKLLRESLAEMNSSVSQAPKAKFQKGMTYLFLAIAESIDLTQGSSEDTDAINQHWRSAIQLLHATEAGRSISDSVQNTLNQSDLNHDGKWDTQEIRRLIQRCEMH